jgi:branched-chain amino acid transport system permease protein
MPVLEGAIIYANLIVLLSLGLTMTYITTAVPNFAQGSFAVFGSYVSLTLLRLHGLNPIYYLIGEPSGKEDFFKYIMTSIPISFVLGGVLGVLIYVLVLKPLIAKGAEVVMLMIATLAVDLILLGCLGAYAGYLGSITKKGAVKFIFTPYDINIGPTQGIFIVSILVILILLFSLFLLLYKTKFGVAMRASMENPSLAVIMGVNVEYTRIFSWFLSGGLAAVAGCLLPFRQEIVPATGSIIIVSIFAASIVGGLGTIYGALFGGYIIGISESYITYQLSTVFGPGILVYGKVISLVILVITLILAPKGLTGVRWRKIWRRSTSS